MNFPKHPTLRICKWIGAFIATFILSMTAFSYAQNCTLLPGRTPNILLDGQTRTGYQIPEASYTQSCSEARGTITCISGSIDNGNTFKYPSCTPHTWANCTTPLPANHLEYKTLYKASSSTYTQTCEQISQRMQCINGSFTGNITPSLFIYSGCIDRQRAQCINIRTNSFMDHGEKVFGYIASYPNAGQTCSTLERTLTCINGSWSGGAQQSLSTGCINPPAFSGCYNIWTQSTTPHGASLNAYTSPLSLGTGTCSNVLRPLTCTNGKWTGNGTAQQAGLYSGCLQANQASCPNIITYTGTNLSHGTLITKYTQQYAFIGNNQYCNNYAKTLQCTNGTRSGNIGTLYTGCQNIQAGSCRDNHTNTRKSPGTSLYRYTNNQPSSTTGCAAYRHTFTCKNSSRYEYNGTTQIITNITAPGWFATCGNCILPRGSILPEGQTILGYSTILRSLTGMNYSGGCSPYGAKMTCLNSVLQGTGNTGDTRAFQPSNYPYSFNQCSAGTPRSCNERAGGSIEHGQTRTGYSVTTAEWPKTCDQNYATQLSCVNGMLNGNRQTYKYADCQISGGLVEGIDLAINESAGLLGQENISGGVIAQGASPQINILIKNKGNIDVNTTIQSSGFLSCSRKEKNINVYNSRPRTNFIINSGTKLGISIRISSIFTQSLGTKTLECRLNNSLATIDDGYPDDDVRSGSFEIVEADRFDLALSKSIAAINKNLEAAEGADGAQGLQNFVYNKVMNVLVPLIMVIGILTAIFGFYKLMFSSDDKAIAEGTRYIIFGVVGIIFIMSAKFLGQNLFDLLNPADGGGIKGYAIAEGLYDKILFPFIKLTIYLVLGAMFIILVSRVITFLFGSDTDAIKKSGTLIGRNVIAMIIIIGAKQIVEAIYGKQGDVVKDITNLGEVGSGILADKNIPILYTIINYALGIASLVILIIIIVQTVQLLMKPDDPAQVKNIKHSLMYMLLGIFILGAGYLIVNFAIIN